MGCSQSTEAASGVTTEQPTVSKNVVTSDGGTATKSLPGTRVESAKQKINVNCDGTDPAEASQGSLDDESVKSFGSDKSPSSMSKSGSKSAGKIGYSSGGSTQDFVSLGDASSVGSGDASSKRNPKSLGHSSSIIGLDSLIENRREGGGLIQNMVHMEVPFGKPIEEVYEGVHTGPVLGSGISGLVRLVEHKETGVKYAVKCLDLGLVATAEQLAQLREEIFIMCQLDHPNIVRLEEVYESHSEIYLVQELCTGGELFDRLDEQPDYHYTEAECARLIKNMLCAVRYLHSKGIIHRDLKLENFLFSSRAKDSELKMIDFGLSKHFRYGEVQHEAVGTPYTVAPEVIRGSYDEKCDIWAIGVIAFLLLSGEPPFGGCGGPEPLMTVRSNILRGHFRFEPEDIWELVSSGAKDFIRAMLVTDPKNRPIARDAQMHSWLKEWSNRNRTEDDNVLNPNVVRALVNFKEFSDMRKLLCEVLSFTLLPDQIKDLRKEFEKMDTDGSGEISLSALKQVLVTNAGAGSLGALTEPEVEDIFNAMRVKKTETRIHWHEFIAAGLSQCQVDDRNLRLAFDRLDSDHKGYVTLDDILDLLGSDALHSEDIMRKMWGDSMKEANCNQARITYDDFLLLMKGQTKESEGVVRQDERKVDEPCIELTSGDKFASDGGITEPKSTPTKDFCLIPGIPLSPIHSNETDLDNTPLSMDDSDDIVLPDKLNAEPIMPLTPPSTPRRGAPDYVSPGRSGSDPTYQFDSKLIVHIPELSVPEKQAALMLPKPKAYVRKRSRSMDGDGLDSLKSKQSAPSFAADARRAVALPEHDPKMKDFIKQGTNKTALQANRELYRAHRQMRLSVLDASKRFEEQQARHARDVLLAKEAENEQAKQVQAGLVMRRVNNKTDSSEAVQKYLEENQQERQTLMEKANKRGGRGRRTRKKTISDMSGMMGSLSQEEKGSITKADTLPPMPRRVSHGPTKIPTVIETVAEDSEGPSIRGATVPGEFRKVNDPFGANGRYGKNW